MVDQSLPQTEPAICEERPTGKLIIGWVAVAAAPLVLLLDVFVRGDVTIFPLFALGIGAGALVQGYKERKQFEQQQRDNPCAAKPPRVSPPKKPQT